MESSRSDRTQATIDISRWQVITGVIVLITALTGCIFWFPSLIYPPLSSADLAKKGISDVKEQITLREDRYRLQNEARGTLLQGLSALLVLSGAAIGAAVALRQVQVGRGQLQATREQLEMTRDQLQQNLEITERGQVTERFTRAIEQLGSENVDVRIGAIYALERLAKDSPFDVTTVEEVLIAYVRNHSPWPPGKPNQPARDTKIEDVRSFTEWAADVQAAMTVLGRLDKPNRAYVERPLLNHVDLRKVLLARANLKWMAFGEVHLGGAYLGGSDLANSVFVFTDLRNAHLKGAKLEGAFFRSVRLEGADLTNANLKDVRADKTTRWPEGFDPRAAGVQIVETDAFSSPTDLPSRTDTSDISDDG